MSLPQNIHSGKVFNNIIFFVLVFFAIAVPFIIVKGGVTIGILMLVAFVGVPVCILLISNIEFGFFSILVLSFFIPFIIKYTGGKVHVVVLEIMMFIVFVGFIIKQIRTHVNINTSWSELRTPIAVSFLVWIVYIHLQFFNPNSSALVGKINAIRSIWYSLLGFILALHVFAEMKQVKTFFKITLCVSLLAALYGLSQKYIGLLPYDREWLYASPERMNLGIIWGQVRAWSFLNDAANFGLLMAFSGLVCFMLMMGPYTLMRKIILGVSGSAMLLAMVASGTRTAFVMVTIGFAIFGLLTINNLKTILFSAFAFLVFMTIYFGPFYSAPVMRIRSAFQGNEDASMNVRSQNKARIQPYIYSHPIGGGPGTTGEVGKEWAAGHPLAGFPPDSGFLRVALEVGFIGLMILMWLYFIASSEATKQYFRAKDREQKVFYMVILCSFVALCSADLTQLATTARPFDFFIFSYFAIIIKLRHFGLGAG